MRYSAILGLAASLAGAAAAAPLAVMPIGRDGLPWWHRRFVAKAAELAHGAPRLVFYGDSIMQYLERPDYRAVWQHYYGNRAAIDLGFKGDPTSALIWRLQHGEADGIAPRLAIVLIGANNFGKLHWSAADTVAGITATAWLIHRKLPHTQILLLGVLPSDRGPWVQRAALATNRALSRLHQPWLTYRDVGSVLERNGAIDDALFEDIPPDPPLHPSPAGWRRIARAIEPVVARTLGDAPVP